MSPHNYRKQNIHGLLLILLLAILWGAFGCTPQYGCRSTQGMAGYHPHK
jgi:hypothetical protein